jgi:CBS domain containing-hemolysin-like protein
MIMFILPILVAALLLASALLAASETALFSLARMEHTRARLKDPVRLTLERLMRRPLESLITIIGLSETANVFAECLGTIFMLRVMGPPGAWLSVPVMLVLVLIFCDITPKTFALAFPAVVASITTRPLAALAEWVRPIARWFAPVDLTAHPAPVSEAEFKALLRVSERQGEIESGESTLIHRVFDFANRRVAEVMTPRDRVFLLDAATPPAQLIAAVAHGHFSRVPVYRGSPDNVIGILHVKDLVVRRLDTALPRLERLLRPPRFVPPGKSLVELFDEMRRDRYQIALVVNEYGRLLGLITLEDLLEELFGELRDEFELEGPELTKTGEDEWLALGGIELAQLEREIGATDLVSEAGVARTLSSFVLRRLGRVPRSGEKLRLDGYEATIERVRGAVIEQVRLKRCV